MIILIALPVLIAAIAIAALGLTMTTAMPYSLALLPFIVVHAFALRAPASMPSALVFMAGLSMDFAIQGPLGFWALVYLAGLFWLRAFGPTAPRHMIGRLGMALGSILVVCTVQYVASSLYLMRLVDLGALVESTALIGALLMLTEIAVPANRIRIPRVAGDNSNLRREG